MNAQETAPKCTGCHFACPLDRYQCGIGASFYESWVASEELPASKSAHERACGGDGVQAVRVPSERGMEHLLQATSRALARVIEEGAQDKLLISAYRRSGLIGLVPLKGNLKLESAEIELVACALEADGKLVRADVDGRMLLQLTEDGEQCAQALVQAHDAKLGEFFSGLDDGERVELATLLRKVLHSAKRSRAGGK